jgi:hypothetical protein
MLPAILETMGLVVNIFIAVVVFILIRWCCRPRFQVNFMMVGLEGASNNITLAKSEIGKVITSDHVLVCVVSHAKKKTFVHVAGLVVCLC